ncbi:Cysteine desulfurase, SufS subfamily [Moritella sp. JT01]|uniref:cysteine desulfurase n=1 Tax=Moritella sp. JT01 TaxID=756698 RepID=UPI00079A24BA|nr:cysteine desulfurase [Moritella sp. JT01]KXO06835.1 Cysteine desulfurase, SufS subfamily [Moritella sp. JT01]
MLNDIELTDLRQQFPVLSQQVNDHPLIYLDNAATSQKPLCVLEAINTYYRDINANVHRASHALSAQATSAYENARDICAQFINANNSKEIIWTRGTTEAINLIANCLTTEFQAGDEIIISTLEHHANIVPWQMLAQRTGAILKVIPLLPSTDIDMQAYKLLLSDKTKLVAVSHVSNAIGTVNPIKEIIALAKQTNAKVLIDGAQAISHWDVDVQALGCDFYVFSGHKMYGPTGIGVLWGKEALLNQLPPWQGGGEMIKAVSFEHTTYNELPFKFEAGTPNIAGTISLARAMNFLKSYDRQALADHEAELLAYTTAQLEKMPRIKIIGSPQHRAGGVSFIMGDAHNGDVGMLLDLQGIAVRTGHHCAQPLMQSLNLSGTIRVSLAIYNTKAEIDFFIKALNELQDLL